MSADRSLGEFLAHVVGQIPFTASRCPPVAPARQVQTTVPLKHLGLESEFQTSDKQLGNRSLLVEVATTSRQLACPRPALLKRRHAACIGRQSQPEPSNQVGQTLS